MSTEGIIMMALAAMVFILMFTVGRTKWNRYAQLARLRADEKVLYKEEKVRVIDRGWGLIDGTYGEGGYEITIRKATVTITDQRILEFCRRVPVAIINYVKTEEEPSPRWLAWRKASFLNVGRKDISLGRNRRGREYLEVFYSGLRGHGVRIRYYFGDMEPVRKIFNDSSEFSASR